MPTRFIRKTAILAKAETTYATDSTPTEGANAILVSNVSINPLNAQNVSRDLIRPYLGGSEQLVVSSTVKCTFTVELSGAGSGAGAHKHSPKLRSSPHRRIEGIPPSHSQRSI